MITLIVAHDGVIPVKKDDMVIIVPKEEKEQRLDHLNRLEPVDKKQYDEITELFDIVNSIVNQSTRVQSVPMLKLVKG